jgi:aspartate carbamoyltransferase catalytic subunit
MPVDLSEWKATFHYSLDATLDSVDLDVVMMLRIQAERMNASFFPSEREYARIWGFNAQRLHAIKSSAIVMHPGPMNRGLEIDAVTADSKQSTVLEQVTNGVAVRMAVLFALLSGERNINVI